MKDYFNGHQGDCPFEKLPDSALSALKKMNRVQPDETGAITILEGEGAHCHGFLEPEKVDVYDFVSQDNTWQMKYVHVKEATNLAHYHPEAKANKELSGEHTAIALAPGIYRFGNQVEQADKMGEIRRLAD